MKSEEATVKVIWIKGKRRLGENRCVMDMPCTDIAEWIAEHDKQLLEDLNEFLVEEKGEYVGSDINEFLAIRKG